MSLTSGDFKSFIELSYFDSPQEMDLAVRSWLYEYKRDLTLTQEKIITTISRLAFKNKGVFAIKHETLAKYVSVSAKTIQRAMKFFIELGLLEVHETRTSIKSKTPKGKGNPKGRGHNVYVIKPVEHIDFAALEKRKESNDVQSDVQSVMSSRSVDENAVTSSVEQSKSDADTKSFYSGFSKDFSLKTLVPESARSGEVDLELMIPHWVPKSFAHLSSKLFNVSEDITTAFKTVRRNILLVFKGQDISKSEVEDLAENALKSYYQQVKERQANPVLGKINEPFAYLSGIAKKLAKSYLEEILECEQQEIFEMYLNMENTETDAPTKIKPPFYNWLEVPECS